MKLTILNKKNNPINSNITYIILFLIYVFIPIFFPKNKYLMSIITTSSIYSCIALGVWLTFSIGRINIGQAAFVAVGGYTSAILITNYGFSFWISLLLAGTVSALFSLILGFVFLRLKGVYFAMITLIFTSFMNLLFLNLDFLTNGPKGILNIPRPKAIYIGTLKIIPEFSHSNNAYYYLTGIILLLCILIVWKISISRIGWVFNSLRQNEPLAKSIGINIVKYRILAYTICGFFAGLGGALFIVQIQNVFPNTFQVTDSTNYLLYCFVGGLDYFLGPVVGAFLLTVSFEILRAIQEWQELIYAGIMIVTILWLPNGLLSIKLMNFKKLFDNKIKNK